MSAGWEVGDLALCVRGGWLEGLDYGAYPEAGAIYTVLGSKNFYDGDVFLLVDGAPQNVEPDGTDWGPLWLSTRFRKIKPDAHEDCEPEFVTLLNRIKRPAKQGEPA